MKTEIIESYQTCEGTLDFITHFMILKVLPLNHDTYAVLKTRYPNEDVIEIRGNINRSIKISSIIPETSGNNYSRIFSFKDGLGYMDHKNSKMILWEELEAEPVIINILKSDKFKMDMRKKWLAFVSYDNTDNTLLIGVNDNKGPAELARYWTVLDLPALAKEQGTEFNIVWNSVHELNANDYPKTYFNHQYPTLEWLNVNDMIKINDTKYCYTTGGKNTRMRSGPEFEFSILSKINQNNQVVKNIEIEMGKRSFSTDKQFFIVRPKTKKRLIIYDVENMEIAHEILLKPAQNLGKIDGKFPISADLVNDKLYVYSFNILNVCKILN